jgi:glycosyltransferase involved in cell wall biosynthesis
MEERAIANYILVGSQAVKEALGDAGVEEQRLICVPYGANPHIFAPTLGHERHLFTVLYVGQISWPKGVHYLFDAWQQLALPDAELVIAGGPDRWGEALLRRYDGHYRYVGGLPHEEVPSLMASCDVFVSPSLWESGPMTVYEAMASGVPVIAARNSAGPIRDGIDGLIVPERDSQALASAIERLYRAETLRKEMGRNGRTSVVNNYTWQHYRSRIAAIYEAITNSENPNRHLQERGLLIDADTPGP